MHRLLRRAAACLAWIALLAVPARGLLACEMAAGATAAPREQPGAGHAGHHEASTTGHAAARVPHTTGAPAGAPHPRCDHVVGCAAAALANGPISLPAVPSTTSAPAVPFVAGAAPSPGRALEPPPPRR